MSRRTNLKTELAVLSVAVLGVLALCSVGLADELHVPSQYGTIQAAINDANDGDTVIVSVGTYYENINIKGKNIILTSTAPTNADIVKSTIIHGNDWKPVATFSGTESPNCVLSGFTITNGCGFGGIFWGFFGAGIYGGAQGTNGTLATIQYNIISGNQTGAGFPYSGWGGGIYNCDGTIQYNIISGNTARGDEEPGFGGGLCDCDGTIQNNVISDNSAVGWNGINKGGGLFDCDGIIQNNTIFGNSADIGGGLEECDGIVRNCIIWSNDVNEIYSCGASVTYSDIESGYPGQGNINTDPLFTDSANSDYHLKSQAGRWDPNGQSWVQDEVTSPCIDAGNPMSPIGYEPFPNGGVINMGAYGGTAEASKSYFGQPVCETVVAGDINGDCKVDFRDFALMAFHWLEDNNP